MSSRLNVYLPATTHQRDIDTAVDTLLAPFHADLKVPPYRSPISERNPAEHGGAYILNGAGHTITTDTTWADYVPLWNTYVDRESDPNPEIRLHLDDTGTPYEIHTTNPRGWLSSWSTRSYRNHRWHLTEDHHYYPDPTLDWAVPGALNYEDGTATGARVKYIDRARLIRDHQRRAGQRWDYMRPFIDDTNPPATIGELTTRHPDLTEDQIYSLFYAQPFCSRFPSGHARRSHGLEQAILTSRRTRQQAIADATSGWYGTAPYVDLDGNWHESTVEYTDELIHAIKAGVTLTTVHPDTWLVSLITYES